MKKGHRIILTTAAWVLLIMMTSADAVAAEGSGDWRSTYDTIMMWINFGILAFVIVKFGREPMKDFLSGRKAELAREIGEIEEKKKEVTARINDTYRILDQSDARFAELKKKIVQQGEKKKQEIIEDAQEQSRLILQTTKQKIESRIVQAKATFRAELIDAATEIALERLPKEITEEDDRNMIEQYLAAATAVK
jgi:F-type H+-transporting ATPase subunit b